MADDTGRDTQEQASDETSEAEGAGAQPNESGDGGGATASSGEPPRRGALRMLVAAGSAVYAGALAVPALRYLGSTGPEGASGGGGKERWMRVAPLNSLPEKTPTRVKVSGDERDAFTITRNKTLGSVWLQRSGDKVTAMSAECPHLGCAIDLGGDGKSFGCPCHTSRFSLEGKAESGPSPRAMDDLAARVKDGWVEVDFRRFRQGAAEKVEVA